MQQCATFWNLFRDTIYVFEFFVSNLMILRSFSAICTIYPNRILFQPGHELLLYKHSCYCCMHFMTLCALILGHFLAYTYRKCSSYFTNQAATQVRAEWHRCLYIKDSQNWYDSTSSKMALAQFEVEKVMGLLSRIYVTGKASQYVIP